MNIGVFCNKNTIIAFIIAVLSMMISVFCYYYLQKNVFTLSVMIIGVSMSCYQAFKCLKHAKKSN